MTAILWTALMIALDGWHTLPFILPGALILFPIGGYVWGAIMWWLAEAAYRKTILNPPPERAE
jgi:hypothetical protein